MSPFRVCFSLRGTHTPVFGRKPIFGGDCDGTDAHRSKIDHSVCANLRAGVWALRWPLFGGCLPVALCLQQSPKGFISLVAAVFAIVDQHTSSVCTSLVSSLWLVCSRMDLSVRRSHGHADDALTHAIHGIPFACQASRSFVAKPVCWWMGRCVAL